MHSLNSIVIYNHTTPSRDTATAARLWIRRRFQRLSIPLPVVDVGHNHLGRRVRCILTADALDKITFGVCSFRERENVVSSIVR